MVTWNMEDLNDDQRKRVETAIKDATPGRSTQPERNEQTTLGGTKPYKAGLVHIPGPLLVRISRLYSGRSQLYDDDNVSGGCKSLRDAIASMLGLKGDSKKDGIEFSYHQERSETKGTGIEIFSKKSEKGA